MEQIKVYLIRDYEKYADRISEKILPPTLQARWGGLLRKEKAAQIKMSWALKCFLTGRSGVELARDIAVNPYGKPYLPGEDLFFSITHAGPYMAGAAGPVELGLDLQTERRKNYPVEVLKAWDLVRDGLTPMEVWTAKEALLKCRGKGWREEAGKIRGLDVSHSLIIEGTCYYFGRLHTEEYSLCLCAKDRPFLLYPVLLPEKSEVGQEEIFGF